MKGDADSEPDKGVKTLFDRHRLFDVSLPGGKAPYDAEASRDEQEKARELRDALAMDVTSRLGSEAFAFLDELETMLLSGDAKLSNDQRLCTVLRRPKENDVVVEDVGEDTGFLYFKNGGWRVCDLCGRQTSGSVTSQ